MKGTLTLCLIISAVLGSLAVSFAYTARASRPMFIGHSDKSLSEIIEQERQAWGMPKGLIEALIDHETNGKWDESAVNPEPDSKCYKQARTRTERSLCASHGLMQTVFRLHGKGLTPEELHNGKMSVVVGVERKLGPCWQQYKAAWGTYYCYNGSGERAARYADTVTENFKYWRNKIG